MELFTNGTVFVKPKDPRELAHLGLARTFVQVRAEGKLVFTMPNAAIYILPIDKRSTRAPKNCASESRAKLA